MPAVLPTITSTSILAVQRAKLTPEEQRAQRALTRLVDKQQTAMTLHRLNDLAPLYAKDDDAQSALETSRQRAQYLFNWAALRKITWTGMTIQVRTPHIQFVNPHRIRFYAVEREQYHYHYNNQPHQSLAFGIASRHYLTMTNESGHWQFFSDDWTNPVSPKEVAGQHVPDQVGGTPPHIVLSGNRQKAVQYANTFCGNAPGCGNDGRYNDAYTNYNGDGGDCTSWISQVLRAGGFRMTNSWNYDQQLGEGTQAWANAEYLKDFLEASGRARLIDSGSYNDVTRSTPSCPHGAIETLEPGDLISYQQHGKILHTAVVVGYDPKGVVLTNAHTNDRFHVPWDFGWSEKTTFYLWHVHYPESSDHQGQGALP